MMDSVPTNENDLYLYNMFYLLNPRIRQYISLPIYTTHGTMADTNDIAMEDVTEDFEQSPVEDLRPHPIMPQPDVLQCVPGPEQLLLASHRSTSWLYQGLGATVSMMVRWDIGMRESPISPYTESQTLGTYNWVTGPVTDPELVIPGQSRPYRSPQLPYNISKDTRMRVIDEDKLRSSEFPFWPAFKATEHSECTFAEINIVADVECLVHLFDWLEGRNPPKFRIDFVYVMNTLFMIKHDEDILIDPAQHPASPSYIANFQNAFTISNETGIQISPQTHRMISYDFGGMSLAVRHTIDTSTIEFDIPHPTAAKMSINDTTVKSEIIHFLPEPWFGRLDTFIYGERVQDKVKDVKVVDLRKKMEKFQEKNEKAFGQLSWLLDRIGGIVRNETNRSAGLVMVGGNTPLQLCSHTHVPKVLPDDMIAMVRERGNAKR